MSGTRRDPLSPRSSIHSHLFSLGSDASPRRSMDSSSYITFRRGQHQQQHLQNLITTQSVSPQMGALLDSSLSTLDTVELVQALLQTSLSVAHGAVRFSPHTMGSPDGLAAPSAPLASVTPTAKKILDKPWGVLTTSGASLAQTPTLHCDDVERCVDNDQHDLIVYRGMILLGWLQVLKLLGCGTFGQVFLCRDLRFGRGDEPETPLQTNGSSIHAHEFLRTTDWGGEDYQYYQCTSSFLPDGDIRRRPYSPRLVALKVIKSISTFEMQSALEAQILVRSAEAAASMYKGRASSSRQVHSDGLLSLDDVPLSLTVGGSEDTATQPGRVAELIAHGLSYGHHCLVMQWYGENLYEYMKRRQPETLTSCASSRMFPAAADGAAAAPPPPGRGLHIERIRVIGRQLMECLRILHEKVVVCHGDIKPENLMLEVAPMFQSDSYVTAEERILNEEERIGRSATQGTSSWRSTPEQVFAQRGPDASPPGPCPTAARTPPLQQAPRMSIGSSAISTALAAAATVHMTDTFLCDVPPREMAVRLVDLGSAFSANQPLFTYIQSRYYRAPEVIVGAHYGTPIDIWSAGCVLAELLLGLPLLPGLDGFHQLQLITDMFGPLPAAMLTSGSQTSQFYRHTPQSTLCDDNAARLDLRGTGGGEREEPIPAVRTTQASFELLPPAEYYGRKQQSPPVWRPYFQFRKLHQLVQNGALSSEEREEATLRDGSPNLEALRQIGRKRKQLYDVLVRLLQTDPNRRITAAQALQMPFFAES